MSLRLCEVLVMTSGELPTAAHTASAEAIALALNVKPEVGLDKQESTERLAKWGANALPVTPPRSPWHVLLAQFKGVMNLILMGAALLAAGVGSVKDASVILAFTTFVLFQLFNVFNARNETGSAFNAQFWLAQFRERGTRPSRLMSHR